MHSLLIYLEWAAHSVDLLPLCRQDSALSLQSLLGQGWNVTQDTEADEQIPSGGGGRVAPSVLIHLGPWREIYELLYSAPMQGNCRIQQHILYAPCSFKLLGLCAELKKTLGSFKVWLNISYTLFAHIDILYMLVPVPPWSCITL